MAAGRKDKKGPQPGLWDGILKEVAQSARTPDATLLVLGRSGIGKRSLLQALSKEASPGNPLEDEEALGHCRATALDFSYFCARDPEDAEAAASPGYGFPAAVSAMFLEDSAFEGLVKARISAKQLRHTAALICLDLKEPWLMMEDLTRWLQTLQRLVEGVLPEIPLAEQDELRARLARGGAPAPSDGVPAPAGPQCNLALPVIVVGTRADSANEQQSQKNVGWPTAIEAHLRDKCLAFNAAIVYTMVKDKQTINIDMLYEYLMHRIYDYPFKRDAKVPSRDALFIPASWDSRIKVDQLASGLAGGLVESFETLVPAPPQMSLSSGNPKMHEEAESMEAFLRRAGEMLRKIGAGGGGFSTVASRPRLEVNAGGSTGSAGAAASPASTVAEVGRPSPKRADSAATDSVPTSSRGPGGLGPRPSEMNDNNHLASFFQNLLHRSQGAGSQSARAPPTQSASAASALAGRPRAKVPQTARVAMESEAKPGGAG